MENSRGSIEALILKPNKFTRNGILKIDIFNSEQYSDSRSD